MDEFYLSDEAMEWLGLKKSEYLSKLIENVRPDDFQFQDYLQYEDLIPQSLSLPDQTWEIMNDGYRIKTFVRSFADPEVFQQVVIGGLIPDQNQQEIFVPIISFVTKCEELVKIFSAGSEVTKPTLN